MYRPSHVWGTCACIDDAMLCHALALIAPSKLNVEMYTFLLLTPKQDIEVPHETFVCFPTFSRSQGTNAHGKSR